MPSEIYVASIDFERVQTFLFAVPRLREMVGANVLIGEVLRECLVRLAGDVLLSDASAKGTLSALTARAVSASPCADRDDPLASSDDPRADLERGILARDGGHFRALFPTRSLAECFRERSRSMLVERLEGLRFSAWVSELGEPERKPLPCARAISPVDLPQLQVCEAMGTGPASTRVRLGSDERWISRAAESRRGKGTKFSAGRTHDLLGQLERAGKLGAAKAPDDFQTLCGTGYMAVIHADGNGVGKRHRDHVQDETDPLKREVKSAAFYHSMRVAVRKAFVAAVETINKTDAKATVRGLQPLMLGGDDLLLVCRAPLALPFLVQYASELEEHDLADGHFLTIGAGVVISRPEMPFHKLHAIAERLAKSAKARVKGLGRQEQYSVVDWVVTTDSWVEDPVAERRRRAVVRYRPGAERKAETLVLTRRPYRILRDPGRDEQEAHRAVAPPEAPAAQRADKKRLPDSVEELLSAVRRFGPGVRSQLRALSGLLSHGRLSADLCANQLPNEAAAALEKASALLEIGGRKSIWQKVSAKEQEPIYATAVADATELHEIDRLGAGKKPARPRVAAPEASNGAGGQPAGAAT